jgi:hypothetical protein
MPAGSCQKQPLASPDANGAMAKLDRRADATQPRATAVQFRLTVRHNVEQAAAAWRMSKQHIGRLLTAVPTPAGAGRSTDRVPVAKRSDRTR